MRIARRRWRPPRPRIRAPNRREWIDGARTLLVFDRHDGGVGAHDAPPPDKADLDALVRRVHQRARLVARNTIEERILGLQRDKRRLAESLFEESSSLLSDLTAEDLDALLS